MPVFTATADTTEAMPEYAEKWTEIWNYSRVRPATKEEVQKQVCKSRRTAPGPDGLLYSMWKSAGRGAAHTLPKGTEVGDCAGE